MTQKSEKSENSRRTREKVLTLYKNRGETPLECLERFKNDNPEYKNEKMTYAGRLDPLAEGLLLVLAGEECKNKEKYLGLDKTYEVDVLFGFSTDTYDLLGKVAKVSPSQICEGETFANVIQSFVGKFKQKYPAFSSVNIKNILAERNDEETTKNGVPSRGELPEKEVEIKDIKIIGGRTISKVDLEKYIIESVNLVKGDFRQKEILEIWKKVLSGVIPVQTGIQNLDPRLRGYDKSTCHFMIVSLRVDCTSGTYMRSLANSIGEKVGIPTLALNIKRTKVDEFSLLHID